MSFSQPTQDVGVNHASTTTGGAVGRSLTTVGESYASQAVKELDLVHTDFKESWALVEAKLLRELGLEVSCTWLYGVYKKGTANRQGGVVIRVEKPFNEEEWKKLRKTTFAGRKGANLFVKVQAETFREEESSL